MKKTVLNNGLRVITIPVAGSKTATVLAVVNFGSRYETKKTSGISHFLEHMYFKGTKKRPSPKKVVEYLDKIGGSFNAFTGHEYTGYYAKVRSNHFNQALEWVSDIFLNSTLPQEEIRKEKNVIFEEINMVKDHPMMHIQEIWMKTLYNDQPAGWNIAGTKESVSGITRNDLINHINKGYVSQNTVVCLAGNIDSSKVGKFFKGIKNQEKPFLEKVIEEQKEPVILSENREIDQFHLCLGVRAYGAFHPDIYVLDVIETILGRMMSSRLFIKIREELGLAYYIKTEAESFSDSGFLVTQAGVDVNKVEKAVSAIAKEYRKMAKVKVNSIELKKAKENIKGRLALSLESGDSQAFYYGIQETIKNSSLSPEKFFERIDKVSSNDILRVSRDIFKPEKMNLALLGLKQDEKKLMNLL